jgi:aryl-alcohol dehydrogenase-like predicted oxidoreductase
MISETDRSVLPRLCVGTVQFGLDYGISNRSGRPDEAEISRILQYAAEAAVGYLDTAVEYGDAEELIGRCLPPGYLPRIVTKLPAIKEETISPRHKQLISDTISRSLDRLRTKRLHAILLHKVMDLAKAGSGYIVEALQNAQQNGQADLIGASVYDEKQIYLTRQHFEPKLIQLPFNVLDRRLAKSGVLADLKSAGVEIHARSIFLQGLLLIEPRQLPEFFAPLRRHLDSLRAGWAPRGLTPLSGSLAFVLEQPEIDVVVVGVNRTDELAEIVESIRRRSGRRSGFESDFAIDPMYLNPAQWPTSIN